MTPAEFLSEDLADVAENLRRNDEPFAFATIVRTAGSTAAKPGAKAVLNSEGAIVHGWLGGGCTRGAVKKAAIEALRSGAPQLVSVAPEELLAEKGVSAGDEVDGTRFARNGCPSKGSVDIFIEPCLPMPQLVVLGASPVALALVALAPQFHWSVVQSLPEVGASDVQQRVIVIATQGQGDMDALESSLALDVLHTAFVGSARKFASLAEKLAAKGIAQQKIEGV
ncbi:XdhC family protein, partial [Planktotalea sp.]|uniref:XdhC family protein n=1 Tax=Planktotalea sp. TaxID=2029877 RepID=UPI0032993CB4